MTEFIVLSKDNVTSLCKDEPVTVHANKRTYILCTGEYFDKTNYLESLVNLARNYNEEGTDADTD